MKKLLSAMWKLPFSALLLIYAAANAFATFKYSALVSGGVMADVIAEMASLGFNYTSNYYLVVFVMSVLLSTLFNYMLVRIWFWFYTLIYARTFNRGRATMVRIRLPFSPSQFASLIFILLIFFNVLVGLVRLIYFAGISNFYLIEYLLVPLCGLGVILFGVYIFNRYILTESVAYNATLALVIPLAVAILLYL